MTQAPVPPPPDDGAAVTDRWWVHIEVGGIQRYVYGSRTLLDAVGRAAHVAAVTSPGYLTGLAADVQVVLPGAGAITVSLPDQTTAEDFAAAYTRKVGNESDELTVYVDVLPAPDDLAAGLRERPARLRQVRHSTPPSLPPLPALGVLRCAVTGAPAERVVRDGEISQPIAEAVWQARRRGRAFHTASSTRLLTGQDLPGGPSVWAIPRQIDQMGRTPGDDSHVAVLVCDFNDLGTALTTVAADAPRKLEAVSEVLHELLAELQQALVAVLAASVAEREGRMWVTGFPDRLQFPLAREGTQGPWLLPIRPWVSAGDDLVLVCDARVSWSLATAATGWLDQPVTDGARRRLYELHSVFRDGDQELALTVGIGIAVVPVGYSLADSHALAEQLCHHAKQRRRSLGWRGHVLDWHRGAVSWPAVLDGRAATSQPRLTSRPYLVPRTGDYAGGWDWARLSRDGLSRDAPGSLRADGGAGTYGWARQRSWVKGELPWLVRRATPGQPTSPLSAGAATRRRRITELGRGTPPPLLGWPLPDDGQTWQAAEENAIVPAVRDALDLLDDHLELAGIKPDLIDGNGR